MQVRFRLSHLLSFTVCVLLVISAVNIGKMLKFQPISLPLKRTSNALTLPQLLSRTNTTDDLANQQKSLSEETHQISEQNSNLHLDEVKLSQQKLYPVPQEDLPWWERMNISHCEENDEDIIYKSPSNSKSADTFAPTIGHCGYRASLSGDNQMVVSYSLYGQNPRYSNGIPSIMEDVLKFYPGWNVRIHTNPELYYRLFCPLLKKYPNLSLCDVQNLPKPLGNLSHIDPMLWRSAPLGDEQVERFIVRDTDSQLSEREAAAVAEWEALRKPIHLMRDHQEHAAPIMGGMFGIWQPPEMLKFFEKMRVKLFVRNKDDDQENLKRVMPRKLLVQHSVQHCSFWCRLLGKCLPFPTQRQHGLFVGNTMYKVQSLNETNSVHQCPTECRPPDHQDWLYC